MKHKIKLAALLALVAMLLIATPVFAIVYQATYTVSENGTASYDMLGVMRASNNQWMADNGFFNSTANDTRIETLGGLEKPHMVTDNMTLTAIPVPTSSQTNLYFTTGNSELDDFYIIPGYDGYISVTDNTSIELGDNFTVTQTGWVNTDKGSGKRLIDKPQAFTVYVSDDEEITARIPGSANISQSYQVNHNDDDCYRYWTGAAWAFRLNETKVLTGCIDAATKFQSGSAFRFNSVNLTQGQLINSASVNITAADTLANDDVDSRITGEDADNAAIFVDLADLEARSHTTANVTWDAIGNWAANTVYSTPDITDIIQEIVNRDDWVSGNSIVIFWEDWEGRSTGVNGTYRTSHAFDGGVPAKAALLIVDAAIPKSVIISPVPSGEDTIKAIADTALFYLESDTINWDSHAPTRTDLNLNAPLWHTELNTSPFTTQDDNMHSCTVNNAIWSSDGYVFDGTDDWIDLPANLMSDNGTIEVWTNSDDNGFIFSSDLNEFGILVSGADIYCYFDGAPERIKYAIDWDVNEWVHLVFSYTRNGACALYANGIPKDTGTCPNTSPTSAASRLMGDTNGDNEVIGTMGEARIYNQVLTPDEIRDNYNATSWKFDGSDEYFYYDLIGAGVPPNSENWAFLQNNVMPYCDNMTFEIDGVTELYFDPTTIITGTTLPDRGVAPANDGTFHWGANPSGVSVALGSMVSSAQPAPGVGVETPTQDILPEVEVTDWFLDPDVHGTLLTNPLRPLVTIMSNTTTLTELQAWRLLGLAFVLFVTVLTAVNVRGHQGITGIAMGVAIGLLVAWTIFPMWALVFAVGGVIFGLIAERSPSL